MKKVMFVKLGFSFVGILVFVVCGNSLNNSFLEIEDGKIKIIWLNILYYVFLLIDIIVNLIEEKIDMEFIFNWIFDVLKEERLIIVLVFDELGDIVIF